MRRELPEQVINIIAQRSQRFHHYLWHRVRNSWLQLTEGEQRSVRHINPLWVPERPALDRMRRPNRENGSGEDFLFMTRQMIAMVNNILAQVDDRDDRRVKGWERVPGPDDPNYPVPSFQGSGLEEVKTREYYEQYMAGWDSLYRQPVYLRSVTLGQLGSDIEFTIYNDAHMRWAAPSHVGYRPTTAIMGDIDRRWDSPAYDYLGDTYSSLVNPIFWKLNGWVSDRVEDWKRANGIMGEIEWERWSVGSLDLYGDFDSLQVTAATKISRACVADEFLKIDRIISESGASDLDGFFRPTPRPQNRLSDIKSGY